MDTSVERQLDPERRSTESQDFVSGVRRKIVGQDEAVQAVVDLYQVFHAGLNSPGRLVGNLLFLGPTGAGKTRVVEASAEVLFGDPRTVIKVDCAEFQHSHEIAKLIGSPPGYLGHRKTHPLITQEALARPKNELLGSNIQQIFGEEIARRFPETLRRVISTGRGRFPHQTV